MNVLDPLEVTVYGTPAPQGSKRHVGNGVMVESSKLVKPWRTEVVNATLEQRRLTRHQTLLDAVTVRATFYVKRPKSHYRTGANRDLLRDGAPAHPMTKPDLDKVVRATLDALTTAGAYRDDAQVVRLVVQKAYADDRPVGADLHISLRSLS